MLPLIVGIEGTALTAEEARLFARHRPAGYILFSRNIEEPEQVRELTDSLRRLSDGVDEPVIAIDQEGGRVVRTAALGVQLPSAAALAATGSSHLIRLTAIYTARCLHSLGVNTDLAPVLDLATGHANALSGRCWGSESQGALSLAGVWNRTMHRQCIMTCGKHFPGMGGAVVDPHFHLPALPTTRDQFLAEPAIPFTALRPELPSIMVAHLMLTALDAHLPSSLSPVVINDFLRGQLGYDGVVYTDDLCMGAIAARYTPACAARLALLAGADAPLICHHVADHLEAAAAALATLPEQVLHDAQRRLTRYRRLIPPPQPPMPFLVWQDFRRDLQELLQRVPEPPTADALSPVNTY